MGKKTLTSSIALAKMREYKTSMSGISLGMKIKDWEPLVSWPACKHIRQKEIDEFMAYPSPYSKHE